MSNRNQAREIYMDIHRFRIYPLVPVSPKLHNINATCMRANNRDHEDRWALWHLVPSFGGISPDLLEPDKSNASSISPPPAIGGIYLPSVFTPANEERRDCKVGTMRYLASWHT